MSTKEKNIHNSFDLEYIISLIKKSWPIFVICPVIGFCTAFFFNKIKLPVYEVGSTLLIKEYQSSFERQSSLVFEGFGMPSSSKKFQNELQILKSGPLISSAINNLDIQISYFNHVWFKNKELYKTSPFIVVINQNHPQPIGIKFDVEIIDTNSFHIKSKAEEVSIYGFASGKEIQLLDKFRIHEDGTFGYDIQSDYYNFKLILNQNFNIDEYKSDNFSFIINNPLEMKKLYQSQLRVEQKDLETSVAQITMKSTVPTKSADIITSVMNEYLSRDMEEKIHSSVKTVEFIDNQLGAISDSLRIAESNLQQFRTSNKVMDISVKSGRVNDQLLDLEREKGDITIKYKYYQYINEYFEKNKEISDLIAPSSMGIEDPLLNNLIEELIQLNAERANLLENNQAKSPYLKQISIKIDNLKNTISENIKYVLGTTEIAVQDINNRINGLNSEINKLPKTERELLGYERKFNLNDAIYTFLLERRAEAQIAKASYMPGAEIIEPAHIVGNNPLAPKKSINYLLGLLLGFIVPLAGLRFLDLIQNKITEYIDIEKYAGLPLLGKVYENTKKMELVVQNFPKSHIAESFRILRTSLNYFIDGNANCILVITSSFGQEGKSFISNNLSVSLAATNKKTILLGFDLRKPKIYDRLNIKNDFGISTFLSNQANIDEVIQHTNVENMDVITSGPIPPNPSELIASSKTTDLFRTLKERYKYVVVDTPPIGLLSDTFVLLDQADLNIYIVRQNQTPRREFFSIISDLKEKKIKNLCLVVNDIALVRKTKYGYDYYEK
jgi:tyrosine-protein kinase Etk/Wzc